MPITEQAKKQEWNKIIIMAQNNGLPERIIHRLRKKLTTKIDQTKQTQATQQQSKKWVTFTYYSPLVHKITNLFKRPNMKIAFRPTNTILQQLSQKPNNTNPSGIYHLKCNTCNKTYIGQSSRSVTIRHKENLRYIKNNNPTSAYAMHILDNRHEFGSAEETLELLKPCRRGTKMNCWEALFTHIHHKQTILISEQQVTDTNSLFDLAHIPRDLPGTL